ncbi:sialomucin core protein 24 isoform X1 [Bufo gargarizans]|uniref:sialomucin core protein 24 isoform X1 n=1 Tax=Bufo gargarizans TaxID=30331 RepID=UPI001CF15086|nr:sialomucin core protein 24 isoform X1 [Bufo gargarizans]
MKTVRGAPPHLLLLPALLLLLWGLTGAAYADTCEGAVNCSACNNISGCMWAKCSNASAALSTVTPTSAAPKCMNSSIADCTKELCEATAAPSTVAPTTITSAGAPTTNVTNTTTSTSTPAATTNSSAAPASSTAQSSATTSLKPSPVTTPSPIKKNTFDAASFIGGIVLVLGVQAVVFFLYKFCKAKDRNYHTL